MSDQGSDSRVEAALQEQIDRLKDRVNVLVREKHEHSGAERALMRLARDMPGFVSSIDERMVLDSGLGSSLEHVRRYVHNVVATFQTKLESMALKEKNQQLVLDGNIQGAADVAGSLHKGILKSQAEHARVAKRVEEWEKAREEQVAEPSELLMMDNEKFLANQERRKESRRLRRERDQAAEKASRVAAEAEAAAEEKAREARRAAAKAVAEAEAEERARLAPSLPMVGKEVISVDEAAALRVTRSKTDALAEISRKRLLSEG